MHNHYIHLDVGNFIIIDLEQLAGTRFSGGMALMVVYCSYK